MAKESYKLVQFNGGTITVTTGEDAERVGEVSVFSSNIEPLAELGLLKSLRNHDYFTPTVDVIGQDVETLDTPLAIAEQSKDVLWYDPTDGFIKVIQDLYGQSKDAVDIIGLGQIHSPGFAQSTWQKRGNRLYIGLGTVTPSAFIKYFDNTQFGVKRDEYIICGNELSPASFFSDINHIDLPNVQNESGFEAWSTGADWHYTISDAASNRIYRFRYDEVVTGSVEAEISNIVGSGLINLTCSQVEDGIIWVLQQDDQGYAQIVKVQINDADFAQCQILKTIQLIKAFTRPDGSYVTLKFISLDLTIRLPVPLSWIVLFDPSWERARSFPVPILICALSKNLRLASLLSHRAL